jgi:ADP-ribose pyrophosphatase
MGKEPPDKGPYRVVSSREVYQSEWLRLREDQVLRPDGAPGTFGVVEVRAGVSTLELTGSQDAYLVREYKYVIEREALEVASGVMEEGETPLAAAQRELREELGVEAQEWVELGAVDYLGSSVRSPTRLFLALDADAVREQRPDPGEIVRGARVPFSRALELVERGEITHGPSCVVILRADHYLRRRYLQGRAVSPS